MEEEKNTQNYKTCEYCGRPLPLGYKETFCPACQETALFHDVRDYIRANDVTEFDVADHFNLPLSLVRKWIREGRIEYKKDNTPSLMNLHCERCGAPVTFGTLCPKCLKLLNSSGHAAATAASGESTRMRYLDSPKSEI